MSSEETLFEALEIFFRRHVHPSSRVCVAVSGGGDSVALFHLLSLLQNRLAIARLGIAHVNHRLRGKESDEDERFVRALAKKAGVQFHLKRLSRRKIPARGIEDWARKQRYTFFTSVMKTHGYDFTATAHTADDQAETVLLRLMRGSGVRGLAGIAPVRDDRVIRPLLMVQKKTLEEWLANHKPGFREDSSNKNTDFTRNWIRHRLLPSWVEKEPRCVQLLIAVADRAAGIEKIMKRLINKWVDRYVVDKRKSFFIVDKKGLRDDIAASESLMSLLRERSVEFDRFHVESIVENKDAAGKTFLLPSGWRYRPQKGTIEFYKEDRKKGTSSFSHRLTIGATTRCRNPRAAVTVERLKMTAMNEMSFDDPLVAFLDAGKIKGKGPLVFRSVSPYEKFLPYGSSCGESGYRKIDEFLKKQKLLKSERMHRGVVSLRKKGEILWVVGLRISDRFKITPQTREIFKISYEPGR